ALPIFQPDLAGLVDLVHAAVGVTHRDVAGLAAQQLGHPGRPQVRVEPVEERAGEVDEGGELLHPVAGGGQLDAVAELDDRGVTLLPDGDLVGGAAPASGVGAELVGEVRQRGAGQSAQVQSHRPYLLGRWYVDNLPQLPGEDMDFFICRLSIPPPYRSWGPSPPS